MSNFKNFYEQMTLLEEVLNEIDSLLSNNVYSTFKELSQSLKKNPRMLFQVYVSTIVIGVTPEEIESNPQILSEKYVRDGVATLMKTRFPKDFADLVEGFTTEEFLDVESEKSKTVIKTLVDEYARLFDKNKELIPT